MALQRRYIDIVYSTWYTINMPNITITLNEYQQANLASAIEATGHGTWNPKWGNHVPRNPLYVLNTGDWIGEIYNMLPKPDKKGIYGSCRPNVSPSELAERANNFR